MLETELIIYGVYVRIFNEQRHEKKMVDRVTLLGRVLLKAVSLEKGGKWFLEAEFVNF